MGWVGLNQICLECQEPTEATMDFEIVLCHKHEARGGDKDREAEKKLDGRKR